MEILKSFFEFIKDKSTSWGQKISIFISVLGLIIIGDYSIGISYNYHLGNKIEKLKQINDLNRLYVGDTLHSFYLKEIENNIFERKHYSEFMSETLNSTYKNIKAIQIDNDTINVDLGKNSNIDSQAIFENNQITNENRKYKWMLISSNYLIVLIAPILILLPFLDKNTRKSTSTMVGWFASIIILTGYCVFVTWIAYKIPLIDNNPKYNYLINLVIHSIFMIVAFLISTEPKKDKTNANNV